MKPSRIHPSFIPGILTGIAECTASAQRPRMPPNYRPRVFPQMIKTAVLITGAVALVLYVASRMV